MNATIKLEKEKHFPVLIDKIISIISPLYGGTFIDCTFGQGGYTKKILKFEKNKVIAFDRDIDSYEIANNFKKKFKDRFNFQNKKFSEIKSLKHNTKSLKGIIFDLGYSTNQIKNLEKGLSFSSTGKLNMKMGLNDFSANEVINSLDQKSLEIIFKLFGEEIKSKLISKQIIKNRKIKNLNTEDLVKIINIVKKKKYSKTHNATKVFQALRIFVNKEISELIYGLINSFKILPLGGVIVVVTFHSIEDKIVKYFFKNYSEYKNTSRYLPSLTIKKNLFKLNNKKPILPSAKELNNNLSSRSAKLRYAIKINEGNDFSDFIKRFQNLLNIESLSEKL